MTTPATRPDAAPCPLDWIMTGDPARVANRHLLFSGLFLIAGLGAALLAHLEHLAPGGTLWQARTFGTLLSLHGTLLVYFVALPLFPGVLANLMLPGLLGGRAFVLPRLMSASWHLLAAGGSLVLAGFAFGGTESGWSFAISSGATPNAAGALPSTVGVLLAAFALTFMGVNIAATVRAHMRANPAAPLAPAAMGFFLSALLSILAGAVLAACCVLAISGLLSSAAPGLPAGFALTFGVFSDLAWNGLLIAALGVATQVIHARTRTPEQAPACNRALILIAIAGFFAWGGFGLVPPVERFPEWVTMSLAALTAAAVGFLIVSALNALRRGVLRLDAALLFALGFLVIAGASLPLGLLLSLPAMSLGKTLFAVAHLHATVAAMLGLAFMAGLYHAWPVLSRRVYSDTLGRTAALITLAAIPMFAGPLYALGRAGAAFRAGMIPPDLQVLALVALGGAKLLALGALLAVLNLAFARK